MSTIASTDSRPDRRAPRPSARRLALAACVLAALVAVPAVASADTLVAADPAADELTALDGSVVWVSGNFGHQVLMRHSAAGSARVKGAPSARSYGTIDLGHDAHNRLVLTYMRCAKGHHCSFLLDDLHGHRTSFKHLRLKRCTPTTAPAVWRTRAAWGLQCRKSNGKIDDKRSGLYVRSGNHSPRHLSSTKDAKKFAITNITSVDLRGTQVAAVVADVYEYAFAQRVTGSGLHSIFAAASEGDSDEHARGLALGPGGVMWVLTDAEHVGDPNEALLFAVHAKCYEREALINPAGPDEENGFLASDLAIDGSTLYLLVPGTGIVTHAFAPEAPGCMAL